MNNFCKIFGHKWRCYMACGSYCSRCGLVYDFNVEDCGVCGGKLFFDGNFLGCKKCRYKHKMNKRTYLKKKKEDYLSNGLIYNWIHKIGVKK